MRRLLQTVIVVTAITLVLGFCVAGTAQAVVIFETSGGANPTTQGFTAEDIPGGSFDSGPPTNWKMAPAGSPAGYYDYSANLGGLSTALSGTDGWTFTYTYKLNAGYQASTAMTRIKDATNRHEFQFFDGFPNSVPFGIGAGWYYYNNAIQLRQIGTVDPTDGFHTYQETLTHVDGGANDIIDYWLDGVHQLQIPRSGMQGAGGAAQAFFGKATASGSASIDQQVALARFETGIHVITPGGLAGDYNNDGTVGAADYVLWRKNVGESKGTLPNDTSSDDPIGNSQYTLWRTNFGNPPGSGSNVTVGGAVPEPSCLTMLSLGGAAICVLRRSSRFKTRRRC